MQSITHANDTMIIDLAVKKKKKSNENKLTLRRKDQRFQRQASKDRQNLDRM